METYNFSDAVSESGPLFQPLHSTPTRHETASSSSEASNSSDLALNISVSMIQSSPNSSIRQVFIHFIRAGSSMYFVS